MPSRDTPSAAAFRFMDRAQADLALAGAPAGQRREHVVRLLFCAFAEGMGLLPQGVLKSILEQPSDADVAAGLHRMQKALGRRPDRRPAHLGGPLSDLPYVGGLFAPAAEGDLPLPALPASPALRRLMRDACAWNWSGVSALALGDVFESLLDDDHRRSQGVHYTDAKDIGKIIDPLFMDDLRERFKSICKWHSGPALVKSLGELRLRLRSAPMLDPACGCGNFLIVALQQLGDLDRAACRAIREAEAKAGLAPAALRPGPSQAQCRGIELDPLSARVAAAGLWLAGSLNDRRLLQEFGVRRPPDANPPAEIRCADAMGVDWNDVLPADQCGFLMGNPPFIGGQRQTREQRRKMQDILDQLGSPDALGALDYSAGWIIKAGDYLQRGGSGAGFVTVNSICQGTQAALLWPKVLGRKQIDLSFAHQTFAWGGDAKVDVIALGMERFGERSVRRLFQYDTPTSDPVEKRVRAITPYLTDGSDMDNPHQVVTRSVKAMNTLPPMRTGSSPLDGGRYILDADETEAMRRACPAVEPFLRPYLTPRTLLHGDSQKHLLCLQDAPASVMRHPAVLERVEAVRAMRGASASPTTSELAKTPTRFKNTVLPDQPYLALVRVSSSQREYIPMAYLEPPAVPSDGLMAVEGAGKGLFALLNSRMHVAWTKGVTGRMKSDLRYSSDVAYSSFPIPPGDKAPEFASLEALGEGILEARRQAMAENPAASMAFLYHPSTMPDALRRAHRQLDEAVDRLYHPEPFPDDSARLSHLIAEYGRSIPSTVQSAPLLSKAPVAEQADMLDMWGETDASPGMQG